MGAIAKGQDGGDREIAMDVKHKTQPRRSNTSLLCSAGLVICPECAYTPCLHYTLTTEQGH